MGKGPRRINPISILVVLAIVGAVYAAVKFVPVYLTQSKVESILADAKHKAAQLNEYSSDDARQKLLDKVAEKILDLDRGIDEEFLEVYLDDDMSHINADYQIVVEHPFGKTTTLEFEISVKVTGK